MPGKDLASNHNPLAQASHLAAGPFSWMTIAIEAGHDDLVDEWFGDSEAIVALV